MTVTLTVEEDGSVSGRYNVSGSGLDFTISMTENRIDITGDDHTVEVEMDATVKTRANIRWIEAVAGVLSEFSVWRQLGAGLAFEKIVSGNNPSMSQDVPGSLSTTTALPIDLDMLGNAFVPILGSNTHLFSANGATPDICRYQISTGNLLRNADAINGTTHYSLARGICVINDLVYVVALDGGNIKLYKVDFADSGAVSLVKTITPSSYTFDYVRIVVNDAHQMVIYGVGHLSTTYSFFHFIYDIDADDLSAITKTTSTHAVFDGGETGYCGVMLPDRFIAIVELTYSYPNYYQLIFDLDIDTNTVVKREINTSGGYNTGRYFVVCDDAVYVGGQGYGGYRFYKYTLATQATSEVFVGCFGSTFQWPVALVGSADMPYLIFSRDNGAGSPSADSEVWDLTGYLTTLTGIGYSSLSNYDINRLVLDSRIWICISKSDDIKGYLVSDGGDTATLTSPDSTGLSFYWIGNGFIIRSDKTNLDSYIEK